MAKGKGKKPDPERVTVVYTPYITLRNGKRLYARNYGLKVFALKIRNRA